LQYGKYDVLNFYLKILVLLATASLAGVGIYGVTLLETKFEAVWFLPPESYLIKWFDANEKYFPNDGVQVSYCFISSKMALSSFHYISIL